MAATRICAPSGGTSPARRTAPRPGGCNGQITFFARAWRPRRACSRPLPRASCFAHAALTDRKVGASYDQRIARAGFGIAQAAEDDTNIHLRDWSLRAPPPARRATAATTSRPGRRFCAGAVLRQHPAHPAAGQCRPVAQGPDASQASYYSQPQLAVTGPSPGRAPHGPATARADNRAWLDHECSQALMHPDAVGWTG